MMFSRYFFGLRVIVLIELVLDDVLTDQNLTQERVHHGILIIAKDISLIKNYGVMRFILKHLRLDIDEELVVNIHVSFIKDVEESGIEIVDRVGVSFRLHPVDREEMEHHRGNQLHTKTDTKKNLHVDVSEFKTLQMLLCILQVLRIIRRFDVIQIVVLHKLLNLFNEPSE